MATQATTPQQREVVEFAPNTPVQIALKYAAGKFITTRNDEQRVMFTLTDDRVMFLDPGPAEKINQLKPKPGEPLFICKNWSGKRNERAEWTAWLSPDAEKARAIEEARRDGSDLHLVSALADSVQLARGGRPPVGEQPDGTFMVPGASVSAPAPARATSQQPSSNGNLNADLVLAEAKHLTDVYAAAWKYARERYEGQVKPEEVKSFVITAYIQKSKGGAYAA